MSGRKRPHCHTCGTPMAGHRRFAGGLVCPDESPPSPPASPGASPSLTPSPHAQYARASSTPLRSPSRGRGMTPHSSPSRPAPFPSPTPTPSMQLEELPGGRWRRRQNPYYHPESQQERFRSPSDSLEPTEHTDTGSIDTNSLVKDENNDDEEQEEEDEGVAVEDWGHADDGAAQYQSRARSSYNSNSSAAIEDGRSTASSDLFFDHVLQNSDALASVFHTPRNEIDRVTDAAKDLGLHFGMIHRPRRNTLDPSSAMRSARSLKRDSSWWMVIGKSDEAVNHILDLQEKAQTMPGTIGTDAELAYTPRLTSFVQLIVPGVVGGLIAVWGLSKI